VDIDQQPGEYLWYDLQDAGALNIRLLHIHFDHFVDNIIDPKDALERRLCEASNHDPTRTQPLHEYAYLNDQPQLPFEYNASNLMEQDAVYRIYTFGLPVGNGGAFGSPMVSYGLQQQAGGHCVRRSVFIMPKLGRLLQWKASDACSRNKNTICKERKLPRIWLDSSCVAH
jgi:hypothetical protein